MFDRFDVEFFVRVSYVSGGGVVVMELFKQRIAAGSTPEVRNMVITTWRRAMLDADMFLNMLRETGETYGGAGVLGMWRSFRPGTDEFVGGTPPLEA